MKRKCPHGGGHDNAFSKLCTMKPWKLLCSEFLVDAPWLKVAKETCELPNGKVIDDFYTLWQPDWVLILARTKDGKWVMTEQYRHGTGKIALEFPAGIIDKGETPEEAAVRELQEECGFGIGERREARGDVNGDSVKQSQTGRDSSTPLRSAQNDTFKINRSVQNDTARTSWSNLNDSNQISGTGAVLTDSSRINYIGSFPVNPDRHRGRFHVVFIDGVERLGKTSFDETEDIETFLYSDVELQTKITDGSFNHPLQIAGYFKWILAQK